ncbi:hypothetical protein SEA_EYRE_52 [Gordonia phage Eyre]|uniref:Uncharacterized protein n=1 Tax=Gordonia phage Eyre TaxID=1887646 RepID=A0A1B3B007_9CAUD|nr:hypothetical protein BIZ73_gp52 [Gordonia phage Eyre]AOE44332.1 hypothetical protein SEA_EYRE_52 [Gordonia phage Eyre]
MMRARRVIHRFSRLTISAALAFAGGWVWTYYRNAREVEHNTITGTGADL